MPRNSPSALLPFALVAGAGVVGCVQFNNPVGVDEAGAPAPDLALQQPSTVFDGAVIRPGNFGKHAGDTLLQSRLLFGSVDSLPAGAKVQYRWDQGAWMDCTGDANWSLVLPSIGVDGIAWRSFSRHELQLRMRTPDGEVSASQTHFIRKGVFTDFDGDGKGDLGVGAPSSGHSGQAGDGAAYVFYGAGVGQVTATADVNLFEPDATSLPQVGSLVSSGGDINGDGYADLLVTAEISDLPGMNDGVLYVYFGGPSGIASNPSQTILDPTPTPAGGAGLDDRFGGTLSRAGDVNGDGYDDLLIGARGGSDKCFACGEAYLFLGGPSGFAANPDRTYIYPGTDAEAYFGMSTGGPADLNGDGYADLILGSTHSNLSGVDNGVIYIFYGNSGGTNAAADLTLLYPGVAATGAYFGARGIGHDVNGDGYQDLVIGAYGTGELFVYLGGVGGIATTPDQTIPYSGPEPGSFFGGSISAVGDVDGDGYGDVVVAATSSDVAGPDLGAAFLYLGSSGGLASSPAQTFAYDLADPTTYFGNSVGSPGDLDGDGWMDLAIGAPYSDRNGMDRGSVYLYWNNGSGGLGTAGFEQILAYPSTDNGALFGFFR